MKGSGRKYLVLALVILAVLLLPVVQRSTDSNVLSSAVPATEAFAEQEAANELEAQLIDVYRNTSPSVVNITSRGTVYSTFMGAIPQEGSGSGFTYDAEGHIVTNYHVIENAEELLVTLASGQVYEAQVTGKDPTNDLAVIQIDAGDELPDPLPLTDSDELQVGQFVVAIGNPFGLEQTMTTGVVSALGRVIESPEDDRFIGEAIQTDAAINPGNSGGPMLDLGGNVIGVNSQIISTSGASAGIGFAISSNTVRRVVPALCEQGYYPHPWLGVEILPLSPAIADTLGQAGVELPVDAGLLIVNTLEEGPADSAGIQGASHWVAVGRYQLPSDGDILTAIDDQPISDFKTLTVYLETESTVGETVQATILRDGKELSIPITLGEQPQ